MQNGTHKSVGWDKESHQAFYDYYEQESLREGAHQRFRSIQEKVLKLRGNAGATVSLNVADVGCGAGTQCILWAESGHNVFGLDINEPLIKLARKRMNEVGMNASVVVGSATDLPWADQSMDICLIPELLEHVRDWERCLTEAARVVRPGGIVFLSTSNKLCPIQNEFELPLYSWYPGFLKRHYEQLAVTTRPDLAGHAKYPAVHWFSFFGLSAFMEARGFHCMDRFDVMDVSQKPTVVKLARRMILAFFPLRVLAHMATPSTIVVAVKGK